MTFRDQLRSYGRYHAIAFFGTFLTYAFFHASRKTLSNSKDSISLFWTNPEFNSSWPAPNEMKNWQKKAMFDSYEDASVYLGVLDTTFMACYSIGLFVSGWIGERVELRKFLALGTLLNALTLFTFGCILPWTNCTSKFAWAFVWGLNGFSQSTGWPTVVSIMGNWFGMKGRGLILGVWSACQSVGNIMGAIMVNDFLEYGFDMSFLFVSICLLCLSVMIFFTMVDHPKMVGLPSVDDEEEDQVAIIDDQENEHLDDTLEPPSVKITTHGQAVTFFDALKLPGVMEYSISYFALKLVNYSFFFWLPYYIHNVFHWPDSESNSVSIWFDVGGIIGGVIGGVGSDLWGYRSPVVFAMAFSAVPSLVGLNNSPPTKAAASSLMALVGFFVGGASNIIGAACAADLGKAAIENGMPSAVAIVTGIIDGTGSVGAAVGQIAIPEIENNFGWSKVFYMFMAAALVSACALIPVVYRELKRNRGSNDESQEHQEDSGRFQNISLKTIA